MSTSPQPSPPPLPSPSSNGISLHVTIVVAPENASQFLSLLKPCYDAVVAEPENLFFEVYQDPEQPGYFRFVEDWRGDREWLVNVQLKKEYYKPYIEATEPLWIQPREFQVFERLHGGWTRYKAEGLRESLV